MARIVIYLAAALLLLGCGRKEALRERELLETVPAKAKIVACVNLDALLKSAACRSNGGRITLTKDIERLVGMADTMALSLLRAVAQSGNVADLSRVVILGDTMGIMVTAPVREELRMHPEADVRAKDAPIYMSPLLGEMEVVNSADGVSHARTASQMWWVADCGLPMGQAVDYVVGAADADPITKHEAAYLFLERAAQCKAIVNCDIPNNPLGEPIEAVYAELRLSDRSISLSMWGLRDGHPAAALRDMPAVDPAALSEMPPGMIAYAAAGVNEILPEAIKQMSETWPLASRIGVGAVIDVMHTDGGTLAIGAAPGGSAETIRRMDLESWLVKCAIPVDPDKGYDAAELIDFLSGGKLHTRVDSVYLEVGSYDLDAYEVVSQGEIYGAPKAVAYASIPYNHQAMKAFRLKNGYTLDFSATGAEATAVLTVHGPASYILPAMISDALTLLSRRNGKN
ncbi:MAG: hypothetical protein NC102_06775 [Clostridium sp.]|nr:hypothetical protein [Clostridium sp.]